MGQCRPAPAEGRRRVLPAQCESGRRGLLSGSQRCAAQTALPCECRIVGRGVGDLVDLDTGTDLLYIHDGWRCIEEREKPAASWEPRRQYVHGGQYIDELIMFRTYTGEQWNSYYYCQQANYNVVALTDSTGEAEGRFAYDPYGRLEVISAPPSGDHYLFQGRRLDSDTGLYYFRNRDYSPELGRFVQRDPVGYFNDRNLYTFSPIARVDPYGLMSTTMCLLTSHGMLSLKDTLTGFMNPLKARFQPKGDVPTMIASSGDSSGSFGYPTKDPAHTIPSQMETCIKNVLEDALNEVHSSTGIKAGETVQAGLVQSTFSAIAGQLDQYAWAAKHGEAVIQGYLDKGLEGAAAAITAIPLELLEMDTPAQVRETALGLAEEYIRRVEDISRESYTNAHPFPLSLAGVPDPLVDVSIYPPLRTFNLLVTKKGGACTLEARPDYTGRACSYTVNIRGTYTNDGKALWPTFVSVHDFTCCEE